MVLIVSSGIGFGILTVYMDGSKSSEKYLRNWRRNRGVQRAILICPLRSESESDDQCHEFSILIDHVRKNNDPHSSLAGI